MTLRMAACGANASVVKKGGPLEQHEYLWASFKGKIRLNRGVRQENEIVLLGIQLVWVVLSD